LSLAFVAFGPACSKGPSQIDALQEELEISGHYLLESANGTALPAPLPPASGCERAITEGELILVRRHDETLPMYSWHSVVSSDCGSGTPTLTTLGADLGRWSVHDGEVRFESMRTADVYPGRAENEGANRVTVAISQGGVQHVFHLVRRWDAPIGYLYALVVDGAGVAVDGAVLEFVAPDGIKSGGTTNNGRTFGTSGVPGTWTVTVQPPAGYSVAPEQANPVQATVTAAETTEIRILLSKNSS
jgi:hypothetical protein